MSMDVQDSQLLQQQPTPPGSSNGNNVDPLDGDSHIQHNAPGAHRGHEVDSLKKHEAEAKKGQKPPDSEEPEEQKIKPSYKSILTRRQYKKRRMYKMAWKSLMTLVEDASESSDTSGSDDLLDDDDHTTFKASRRTTKVAQAEADAPADISSLKPEGDAPREDNNTIMDKAVKSKAEKAPLGDVLYKAEFYHYLKSKGEQKPKYSSCLEGDKPILTARAKEKSAKSKGSSVLEITTMYAIPRTGDASKAPSTSTDVLAELGVYLTIRSKMILDTLQDLIPYYPTQSFANDDLVLQEPFCPLLHYYEELKVRRDSLRHEASQHDSLEVDDRSVAHEHLTYVVDFVSGRYAEPLAKELALHRKSPAMCTYDWVWLLFRPGTVVYRWSYGNLTAYVVESHRKDKVHEKDEKIKPPTFSTSEDLDRKSRPPSLSVAVWHIDFYGDCLGRRRKHIYIDSFDGEKEITSLPIFPKEFLKHEKRVDPELPTEESLIQRGRLFFGLTKRCYKEYDGKTAVVPKRSIRGRIMVDTKYYYDSLDAPRPVVGLFDGDERRDLTVAEDSESRQKAHTRYGHYDEINPKNITSLQDEQYLVCNSVVWAFVLKNRVWEMVNVKDIQDPKFQGNLINDLVLDPVAKTMIKALSQRYTQEKEANVTYSADFIRNKGEGQIFLLHGKPGVGKTTTAECVAELTKRPLLSLTCGDLGIEPLRVEENLTKWFKLATTWEAILLLDEADVYLESRISQDLQRNTLVSIFLRALEYYQGILFLTTNRVGTFDDGFISRIHVIIHYPDFTNEQRCQIWDIFFNKLERERENIKVTQRILDYAKESDEMKGLGWNGREIRNAFNTAVSLAECDDERDAKNRIVLHARHLEQVVKMSKAFQDYLKSTQRMSQAEAAYAARVRNDFWKTLSTNSQHSIASPQPQPSQGPVGASAPT